MVFSSIPFICAYLPVAFILYIILPGNKARNIFLIIISLIFYAVGESVYVFLMIGCVIWNTLVAGAISRSNDQKRGRIFLILCITVDLTVLAIFKYSGFVAALPIGISFYTFQAISYVVDVYKKKIPHEENIGNLLLYVSFFPQLIAGPIVRYQDISGDIQEREIKQEDIAEGLRIFIFGLSKKVLISDNVGKLADYAYSLTDASMSLQMAWIGAIAYTLQIYFDFSGYSEMAVGLGRIFGFHLPRNFNYPYIAGSMLSFWKRWHITLTDWFREYLYIPLGGNRKGKVRTLLNRMIVFSCVGIWHGVGMTFIAWGVYHGLLTIVEVLFPNMTKHMGIFRHVYTLAAIIVGFVIFRADTIKQAFNMINHMFVPVTMDAERIAALYAPLNSVVIAALIAGIVASLPLACVIKKKAEEIGAGHLVKISAYIMSIPLFLLCIMSLAGNGYHPFIYFRF